MRHPRAAKTTAPDSPAQGGQRGFTLLEVIVAFTILALIAVVLYASLDTAMDTYTRSQEKIEKGARSRILRDYMRRQLGSLFPLRPTASFVPPEDPEFDPEAAQQALIRSQVPLFSGTPYAVTFITVAPLQHLRNPGLTVVTYGRAEDEFGDEYLGAMETRFMGLESFNYMAGLPRGKPLPIIEDTKGLHFRYYGYDAQADDFVWLDEWAGDTMGSVPSALRIDFDNQRVTLQINATSLGNGLGGSFVGGAMQRLLNTAPQAAGRR